MRETLSEEGSQRGWCGWNLVVIATAFCACLHSVAAHGATGPRGVDRVVVAWWKEKEVRQEGATEQDKKKKKEGTLSDAAAEGVSQIW